MFLGIINDAGVLDGETIARTSLLIDRIQELDGVVPGGVVSFKTATSVPEGDLSPAQVDRIVADVDRTTRSWPAE